MGGWRSFKEAVYDDFDGSRELFDAAWLRLSQWVKTGAINTPRSKQEMQDWVDGIASEFVNDPKSKFYIKG